MLGLERIRDATIWRIYAVTLLVGLAYGISISLTAIQLDASGFNKEAIGTLAACFAGGLVLFSMPMGWLIRKLSAQRVLTYALVGYAVSVAVFPWLSSYTSLAAVRFMDGACSVAVWVSCETIILSRSEAHHKAFTTSLYAVALAVGYVMGPLLSRVVVSVAPLSAAFAIAGALSLAGALYVRLCVARDAREHDHPAGSVSGGLESGPALLWKIKNSCFATFAYGYFQATVVLFLPLYLMESKNITREQTIVIPAFFAAGMLLFSNFAGRAGDRYGHLFIMRWLAAIGATMILGFVFLDAYVWMCVAVFTAGASLATISPVSLALQSVQCEPSQYGRATGLYNMFYAGGILLGPPVASRVFEQHGGKLMLYHLVALWAAFIVFSLLFARDDPHASPSFAPARGVDS